MSQRSHVPYPDLGWFMGTGVDGQHLCMARLDVAPSGTPVGRTVVLVHGFDFASYAFAQPADQGWRES